jgi:predicted nucleotide-binding protein
MGAKRYQQIEHAILTRALQGSGSDNLGYSTTLHALASSLAPTIGTIEDRELMESLMRLQPQYLALWKWDKEQNRCLEYPAEFGSDVEFFYGGDFRLRRTLNTDPYLQDLAAEISSQEAKSAMTPPINDAARKVSRKVFVVHGHDEGARETVARFLERLDFEAIILHEQASRGRTVIEKVEDHGDVGFAVVLLTPDDEGCAKGGTLMPRARQNVVLELGYFVGRLGRDRVCALKRGEVEIPSDFNGVVYVPFDNSGAWKQMLGKELQAARFEIDWNKVMRS